VRAHLLKPETVPPPPQLQAYWLERRFHQEFGVPAPPLAQWPARKISDFVLIQQALDEVEAQRQRPDTPAGRTPPGPAGGASPAATEQAFQAMRAQAKPPPMPPAPPP
jgi:hypothetical protein